MRQSMLLTKTRKEGPKDEVSKNAGLLVRAGFINKEMAGVYSYLPLGLRVLKKIENIIREEMDVMGGQELHLTCLQDPSSWQKTGRWDDAVVDNWFKTKLKGGTELGLGFTHEEPLTLLMKNHIRSYRDLPVYPYQIQTKFRNEARAKSGMIRGREFLMKDLYSFSKDKAEHDEYYERMKGAYKNVYDRSGIGEETYITFATGGSFSKYSHEFQTISDAGEDSIFCCDKCKVAVNKDVIEEQKTCPTCGNDKLIEKKAVEVGNIFTLGEKFSDALDLSYLDEKGEKKNVFMGSYGIGVGRLMGVVVELHSDEKGIIWPETIAPYKAHIVNISTDSKDAIKMSEDLYGKLTKAGVETIYDDRELRAGEKFNDADLIGVPWRIVISDKLAKEGVVELKKRDSDKKENIKISEIVERLSK